MKTLTPQRKAEVIQNFKNERYSEGRYLDNFVTHVEELGLEYGTLGINQKVVYRHVKETYSEYVHNALNRKNRSELESSHTNGSAFTGTKDYAEAVKLAKYGWDYGLKELPIDEGVYETGLSEFVPSVVGGVVNLTSYLAGRPDSMFEIVDKREYNLPELTFYTRLTYLAQVSVEDSLEHCKRLMDIINKACTTHNVRLIGIMDNVYHNSAFATKINDVIEVVLKDFDRPLVINNIAYAFHSSFFRRIGFSRDEEIQGLSSGYGSDMSDNELIAIIKQDPTVRGKVKFVSNCTTTMGNLIESKHVRDIK